MSPFSCYRWVACSTKRLLEEKIPRSINSYAFQRPAFWQIKPRICWLVAHIHEEFDSQSSRIGLLRIIHPCQAGLSVLQEDFRDFIEVWGSRRPLKFSFRIVITDFLSDFEEKILGEETETSGQGLRDEDDRGTLPCCVNLGQLSRLVKLGKQRSSYRCCEVREGGCFPGSYKN